jgi:glycosyltransferase involved in cell wall biosynthesis
MNIKPLHILFLTSWYPSRVHTTLGDFIQRHAQAVSEFHQVSVLHVISDPNLKKNISYEFKIENKIPTYIAYIPFEINPIKKIFFFLNAYLFLLKKVGEFDLIHLNKLYPSGVFALYLKLFKQKKYLISEHWSGYQFPNNKAIGFFEKWISKIITKYASFVCPVTEHLARAMQDFGLKGTYYPIPNVVDTEIFKPREKKNENLIFTHISSLNDNVKNIKGILNVLAAYKKFNLNFTGYFVGGKKDEFITHLLQLDINEANILFVDHLPHAEMVKILQKSDLFLMFSNFENLPCVILESFSCGVPVISTNVGGISEYFPENFGKLIPVKGENEMLKILLNFDKTKWAEKNIMHHYVQEHFSKEKIAITFNKLYIKMI